LATIANVVGCLAACARKRGRFDGQGACCEIIAAPMARAGMFCALVVAAAACGESRAPAPQCAGGPCPVERVVTDSFQQAYPRSIDLLFVVDDTPAIAPYRQVLQEDFGRLAAALEAMTPGGLAAIHVGVVSAAGGDTGCAPMPPRGLECGLAPPGRFLATKHCGRMPNFSRPFTETLPCMADLGAGACGAFQPLAALRRALDPAAGGDSLTGFLRPDAYLIVVIVGAQEDASGEGTSLVADTAAFLEGLKEDPSTVVVSFVALPVGGEHPLLQASEPAFSSGYRYGRPCFVGARDTNPAMPGLQPECTVEDRSRDPDAPEMSGPRPSRALPSCDLAAPPCWRLEWTSPSAGCSRGSALFTIEREIDWCAQTEINTTVTCLGCAQPNDPACEGP
jgi:hypothetical protein